MAIINVDDMEAEIAKVTRAMGTYKKSNRLLYEIYEATNTIDDLGVGKSTSSGKVSSGQIDANSTKSVISFPQFNPAEAITFSAKGGDLVFSVLKGGVTVGNKLLVIDGTNIKTTLGALNDDGEEIVAINNNGMVVNWSISL
jgi:hypothetical protein